MGDKSPPLWTKRVDRGLNNTILCRHWVEPCDMVSNDSISPCSTRYHVERINIVLFNMMFRSRGPRREISSRRCVLDLDHHHTCHHQPSTPLFLIDQCQRDGCDNLPVARRSSGKKGGGGWGLICIFQLSSVGCKFLYSL